MENKIVELEKEIKSLNEKVNENIRLIKKIGYKVNEIVGEFNQLKRCTANIHRIMKKKGLYEN